jgi:hypothetical protein
MSPNKIAFMFIFLIYHGILSVPMNNYSNAIKVTKCWTLSLCKNTIIKVLYHWASPYTSNWWWCTVDCGWVYRISENIDKSIVVLLLNSRIKKKKNMTITRKGKSCKQTQIVSKDIDENEINDIWYAA